MLNKKAYLWLLVVVSVICWGFVVISKNPLINFLCALLGNGAAICSGYLANHMVNEESKAKEEKARQMREIILGCECFKTLADGAKLVEFKKHQYSKLNKLSVGEVNLLRDI